MSSHHIVRDEQEPALVLAAPNDLDSPWLGDLLEWSPVVLVLEDALDKALSLGFKMDIVFCQSSNVIEIEEKVAHQYPIEVIGNEEVSLASALDLLAHRQHVAINIITPVKPDLFSAIQTLPLDIVLYQSNARIVRSSNHSFEKWFKKGVLLEICEGEVKMGQNLRQTQPNQFHVLEDGLVSFTSSHDFWLQEPL